MDGDPVELSYASINWIRFKGRHAAQIAHAVAAGGTQQVLQRVPMAQRPQAAAAIHLAFTSAMNEILLVGGVIALLGAVAAVALVRGRDFATHAAAPEPAAATAAVAGR